LLNGDGNRPGRKQLEVSSKEEKSNQTGQRNKVIDENISSPLQTLLETLPLLGY
jgi:hypothetical protein